MYGEVDNKTILESSDDYAYKTYGEGWHIPTCDDYMELYNNCKIDSLPSESPKLFIFVSPNGSFLPFETRGYWGVGHWNDTNLGYYWTSELLKENPIFAKCFIIGYNECQISELGRSAATYIHGVKSQTPMSISGIQTLNAYNQSNGVFIENKRLVIKKDANEYYIDGTKIK